jgi:NADH dehydrogenase
MTIRVGTRAEPRADFLKPCGDVGQIVPWSVNIHDEKSVRRAVENTEIAINCVGILHESRQNTFDAVHHQFPARLAELAAEQKLEKLVHVSSLAADEHSDSDYATSKALGDQAILSIYPDATIFRPSLIFGPEDDFFNRFAKIAKFSPIIPIFGADSKFQPVYVGDVAEAITLATTRDEVNDHNMAGKIYECGGPSVHTFRQLMEIMCVIIRRDRKIIDFPIILGKFQAFFLERLPNPPITRDQLKMLAMDNVVGDEALTLRELNITPTALEAILPSYLKRFKPGGYFAD